MVLLQLARPKVFNWTTDKPSDSVGLLEGNGERPACQSEGTACRDAKDACVLPRKSTERQEDRLGHARVSDGRAPRPTQVFT
jgi:hypothetical protein